MPWPACRRGSPPSPCSTSPRTPAATRRTAEERRATVESLLAEAGRRPLVVVCDDAYAGLVFEPEIPRESPFWDLAGAHPNLLAVKVDGATKEFSFFGGRVGFLTFGVEPESDGGARAREQGEDAGALGRGRAGGGEPGDPPRRRCASEGSSAEIEAVRLLLEGRYRALEGGARRGRSRSPDGAPLQLRLLRPGGDPRGGWGSTPRRPPASAGPPRHRPDLARPALPPHRPLLGGRGGAARAGAAAGAGDRGAGVRPPSPAAPFSS